MYNTSCCNLLDKVTSTIGVNSRILVDACKCLTNKRRTVATITKLSLIISPLKEAEAITTLIPRRGAKNQKLDVKSYKGLLMFWL
ncbi:hypothetical protein LguiA_021675 [Lonicera macranthoides]